MASLAEDWDSIPAKSGGVSLPAKSLSADWDAIPASKAKQVTQALPAQPAPAVVKPLQQIEDPTAVSITGGPQSNPAIPEAVANIATGVGSSIIGGWRGLATLATGGTLDDAANAVHEEQEKRTYQPESEGGKAAVELFGSGANPLNWPAIASKKAGEVAQDMGASPGVATGLEVAGNIAIPIGVAKGLKLVRGGEKPPVPVEPERIEPTLQAVEAPKPPVVSAQQQAAADAVSAYQKAAADPKVPLAEIKALGEKAKAANLALKEANDQRAKAAEAAPIATAEPTLAPVSGASRDRFATSAEIGEETPKFLEAAPEAGPTGGPEYNSRAGILKRVGLTEARESALTGDVRSAATDFQQSKVDDPAGRHMMAGLQKEKAQLEDYSEGLVRETGGTLGAKDTSTLYSRGNTILSPLESLNNYFNKQVKDLYTEADKRAGGQPVEMPKTHEFVGGDKAEFLGTTEGEALLRGINARMKSLGMVDEAGAPKPVTVKQAEQLKQYLGNQWSPRTSRLIASMKNAIDDDVMVAGGEDIYRQARAMRAMKASVFENDLDLGNGRTGANGISKLIDANGKGVELLKDTEKVADFVTAMPADQLAQVVKTLKNLPKELKPQGEAALSEIKAQFANKIHEIGSAQQGQWAAKNVSKYLNQNAARMQQVFTPDELSKFNDLNDAGHILAKDQSYPGAAVQGHNLLQRGALGGVELGSTALGAAIAGPIGAVVGKVGGKAVTSRLSDAAALKAAQKRFIKLSDIPE